MAILTHQLSASPVASIVLEYDDSFNPPRVTALIVVNASATGGAATAIVIRLSDSKLFPTATWPAGTTARYEFRPNVAAERVLCDIGGGGKPIPRWELRFDLPTT